MAPHSGKVEIDDSRWPLLVITQLVDQLTDDERLSSLAATDQLLEARPGRYAIVLDNRRAGPVPPKQRALLGEYGKRNEERVRTRCIATALVMSTEVMRGMATAIQWQMGKVADTQVFDRVELAIDWAVRRLAQTA